MGEVDVPSIWEMFLEDLRVGFSDFNLAGHHHRRFTTKAPSGWWGDLLHKFYLRTHNTCININILKLMSTTPTRKKRENDYVG